MSFTCTNACDICSVHGKNCLRMQFFFNFPPGTQTSLAITLITTIVTKVFLCYYYLFKLTFSPFCATCFPHIYTLTMSLSHQMVLVILEAPPILLSGVNMDIDQPRNDRKTFLEYIIISNWIYVISSVSPACLPLLFLALCLQLIMERSIV